MNELCCNVTSTWINNLIEPTLLISVCKVAFVIFDIVDGSMDCAAI